MILVTNDDGYTEGLKLLLEAARKLGPATAIVPNRQRSAVSCALTLHKPLRLHKMERDIYTLNGTPSDCVLFSTHTKDFEKPSLILSGINWGNNTGISSLLGSGTLGACHQAALEGIPAIAFSLHTKNHDYREKTSWGDSKKLSKVIGDLLKLLKPKLKPGRFFNVNLPDELSAPKIIYIDRLQKNKYKTLITKRFDPNGVAYFWMSGSDEKIEKGTDVYEVEINKNITIHEVKPWYLGQDE